MKSLILGYMGRRGCTFFKLCRGWLASDCGGSFIALCCIVHNANVCALGDCLGGSFFNFLSSRVLVLWVSIHYKWPSCFRESEFTVHVLGNELEMLQVQVFVCFSQFFFSFWFTIAIHHTCEVSKGCAQLFRSYINFSGKWAEQSCRYRFLSVSFSSFFILI